MTCARTEEGDEDTKVSQTAQWKTSTLVMWSFSWRALKKRDLLFQPLMEDDVFGFFFLKKRSLPSRKLSSMGRLNRRLLCSITSCGKMTGQSELHQISEGASSPASPSYLQEGHGQVVVVVLLLNVLHRVPVRPAFQVVLQLLTV